MFQRVNTLRSAVPKTRFVHFRLLPAEPVSETGFGSPRGVRIAPYGVAARRDLRAPGQVIVVDWVMFKTQLARAREAYAERAKKLKGEARFAGVDGGPDGA